MITAKELYEDLKNHVFYDLEKAYTYIFKKYMLTPLKSENIADDVYEDTYGASGGTVLVSGLKDSTKRHFKVKCRYILIEP